MATLGVIAPVEVDDSLPRRFSRVAAVCAERPAIQDGDRGLTYGELDRLSTRIACALLEEGLRGGKRPVPGAADCGIGPGWEWGVPVAILLDQGMAFAAALLGVLKAGRFYVPLDTRFPIARTRLLLDDAAADVLVTTGSYLAASGLALPDGLRVLDIEGLLDLPGADTGARHAWSVEPDAPAVILYTSGSTGKPKGVVHTHRSLLHNMQRHAQAFGIHPADRQSLLYSCTVYGGARDIFNALLNGASLHRYPLESAGVAPLPAWLHDQRITIYCSVATVFRRMISALADETFPALRLVKLGGEAVFRSDVELLRRHFPESCRLSCGLAATEVGAVRQVFIDLRSSIPEVRVSCGQAIDGVETQIVDDAGREVPRGVEGHIVVRSRYMALGYWRRGDLTTAAFSDDAAPPGTGSARVYRTGDRGKLLPDGELVHLGRADRQVKVHGNRIEPAEIEAVLSEAREVREVAVVVREEPGGRSRLVAYVASAMREPSVARLREFLASRVPAFMIPSAFVFLERLPLLPSGKLDRLALRDPWDVPAASTSPGATPATPTEKALLELWREVLGARAIGVHDAFFEHGGDSLRLIELVLRVELRLGVRLTLSEVLEVPTVTAMAERIDSRRGEPGPVEDTRARPTAGIEPAEVSLVPIQPRGDRPPLFFAAPAGGGVLAYYALAHRLGLDQPFHGVQVQLPVRRMTTVRAPQSDLPSLARQALRQIRTVQPAGPYHLGGWSFGGFLAFELASQIAAAGERVERLLVIDSDPLVFQEPPSLRRTIKGLWLLARVTGNARLFLRDVVLIRLARARRRNRMTWSAGLGRSGIARALEADPRLAELRYSSARIVRQIVAQMQVLRAYRPGALRTDIDFFHPQRAAGPAVRPSVHQAVPRWRELTTGHVRVHPLTGHHFNLLEPPHLDALAAAIGNCLGASLELEAPACRDY